MAVAMTEIKFWIAAFDCGDVSVTAIFCNFFFCTAKPANSTKNTKSKIAPRSYWWPNLCRNKVENLERKERLSRCKRAALVQPGFQTGDIRLLHCSDSNMLGA